MYAASVVGSQAGSVYSKRFKLGANTLAIGRGSEELDPSRRPSFENAVFGVLFTLSKENSETRIVIRWVLLKILLDGWQIFTTVIQPDQGWDINPDGTAWKIVNVLSFNWLADLGYGAYVALLYGMVTVLALNIGLCVWVAWCFKEQKFPVVWPIQVVRLVSSIFFQAFDVASLNLLQIGFTCNYTGPTTPHMYLSLFPSYSCSAMPQVVHAVVSGVSLLVFIALALLTNMAEVEVNPKSRRPMALGHSGAEVMAFAIKVAMTLTNVFLGWKKVVACIYLGLSMLMAYQYLRWNPSLVNWVNYLKTGLSVAIVWCSAVLIILVFQPGVSALGLADFQSWVTIAMLAGIAPAIGVGAALSWWLMRRAAKKAIQAIGLASAKAAPLEDIVVDLWTDPRDVEIAARCCRVWVDRNVLDKEAVARAQVFIKAGLALFPGNAFVSLVQANFMIDVLGVGQSGSRQIEAARKLKPGIISRFIIFVRMQQAQQKAAGTNAGAAVGNNMDLLGFVEYQRKQRMVVRLHRDALTAMCSFWKALDSHTVSFTYLSKALASIEVSVIRAQAAYHLVLETYGTNYRLVRLYGKFLETVKNDPWGALEYYTEADRLEQEKNDDGNGPLLPDGTPLSRMDELSTAVVVVASSGEIQMANKQVHHLFGYKKGDLDGKPMTMLLAPQSNKRITKCLASLVERSMAGLGQDSVLQDDHTASTCTAVLAMHHERMAFPLRVSITKASGVGEDSTFIALLEPVHVSKDVSYFWVSPNGVIAGCDPQFVANFGFMPHDVIGAHFGDFVMVDSKLLALKSTGADSGKPSAVAIDRWDLEAASVDMSQPVGESVNLLRCIADRTAAGEDAACHVSHRYSPPFACVAAARQLDLGDAMLYEVRICRASSEPYLMMVIDRKGAIKYASPTLTTTLCPRGSNAPGGQNGEADAFKDRADSGHKGVAHHGLAILSGVGAAHGLISGYTLQDFLPHPWKDTHVKLVRDATAAGSRNIWSCNRQAGRGPTMELHDAHGLRMYMHVAATSAELVGEHLHIIRMAPSSVDVAVSERRLRLTVNSDGIIMGVSKDTPSQQLFGFDSAQLTGRPLWEVVDGVEQQLLMRPGSSMGRVAAGRGNAAAFSAMLERVIHAPGRSYRVSVVPPSHPNSGSGSMGAHNNAELAAAQRAAHIRRAVMHIHIPVLESDDEEDKQQASGSGGAGTAGADGAEGTGTGGVSGGDAAAGGDENPSLFVDLWPTSSLSGVLELNALGRITAVLEEHARPAGLLFGLPTKSLVGQALPALIPLPPGREEVGDLLSSSVRNKKSSLKQSQKDPTVKVGPIHQLTGHHADGRPLKLNVQVIGKPGPGQPLTVLIRVQPATTGPNGAPAADAARDKPLQLPPAAAAPRAPAAVHKVRDLIKEDEEDGDKADEDDDSTPSIRDMEDFVAGRSFNLRGEKKATAGGMCGSATGLRGGGTPPTGGKLGQRFIGRVSLEKDKAKEEGAAAARTLEKSATSKSAAAAVAAAAVPGSAGGARPATPSTPVKAPAELLAAHANGSQQSNNTAPPGSAGAAAGGGTDAAAATVLPAAPLNLPAALAALGLGMDLPLPGVVTAGGQAAMAAAASRRSSVVLREAPSGPPPPPPPPGAGQASPVPHHLRSRAAAQPSPQVQPPLPPPPPPKKAVSSLPGSDEDSRSDMEGSAGVSQDGASSDEDASSKDEGGKGGKAGGGDEGDDEVQMINPKHLARIKEWVETKGEVYQNTRAKGSGGGGYEEQPTTVTDADDGQTSDEGGKATKAGGAGRDLGGVGAVSTFGVRPNPFAAGGAEGVSRGRSLWGVASRVGSLTAGGAAASGEGAASSGRRPSQLGAMPPGLAPPAQGTLADFDDNASNGGQSVMSGNSGGTSSGAEYKRGKRFRNLVKLMDSSEAEQVLRRFRHGALLTMGILAIAHTICFAMVVISIKGQQTSMAQLKTAGSTSRLLSQVLTNVRALDQIHKNKTVAALYTKADVPMFAERIFSQASELKDVTNYVAENNWGQSTIRDLYYFTTISGWYSVNQTTGEDIFKAFTLWDMATKVYTASKDIYQNHLNWTASGLNISSTPAGQFLLKSGMDLFAGYRQILNALLYNAMDNTEKVKNLLLAFLIAEGCGVSVLAAALLAYLLRKLAVQRYTLYGTFLAIPVGLTRALNAQLANTTLLEEEDEDESDEEGGDEDGKEEDGGGGGEHHKHGQHRHATLEATPPPPAPVPSSRPRPSFQDTVLAAAPSIAKTMDAPPQVRQTTSTGMGHLPPPSAVRWRSSSFRGRFMYRLGRCFPCLARRSQTVFPTPLSSDRTHVHGHHKRTLKLDSSDTTRLLIPFVLWSCLVVTFYAVSVAELKQSAPLVGVSSVCNFNTGRTYRACYFAQELAAEEDPALLDLRRAELKDCTKMLRDSFYTLQLGDAAWRTLGNDTERFPLVTDGLSYESPELQHIFYSNTDCLRSEPNLPCPGPEYKWYQLTRAGVDSIMQLYLGHLNAMVEEVNDTSPGLDNVHFDFVYNVGTKDLTDANLRIGELHYEHIKRLFSGILLLHILLFVMLWFFLAAFYGLLLKPLLARLAREKRHIAELMSQLPLELDVEKLVRAALASANGTAPPAGAGHPHGPDPGMPGGASSGQLVLPGAGSQPGGGAAATDAARAWKNVLRSTSNAIKDANQARAATRERRASMMSTSMAFTSRADAPAI